MSIPSLTMRARDAPLLALNRKPLISTSSRAVAGGGRRPDPDGHRRVRW